MNVYPFIDAEKKSSQDEQRGGNVKRSCELLGVSRTAYYADAATQAAGGSARARQDAVLTEIIGFHDGSGGTYGSPRVHADLIKAGLQHGRKRLARFDARGRCLRQDPPPDGQDHGPRPERGPAPGSHQPRLHHGCNSFGPAAVEEPSWEEMYRALVALQPFVTAHELPVNLENLELMVYAMLRYLRSSESVDDVMRGVERLIEEEREERAG